MALSTWSFPTTIVFGPGALSVLPAHIKRLNAQRPLLVCDQGIVMAGLALRVQQVLEAAGLAVAVFDKVDPNPVESNVSSGVAAFKAHKADLIVSLGGGSPLDVGKLIALKSTHDRPLHEYDDAIGGDALITSNVPPIITVPTTAGTGSEVGRSGVVTLEATGRKTVIFSPYFMAKVAILDPELTATMPARITAATGFDALTHCLEAYCSLGDHPMADAIALGGLELCAKSLARAVESASKLLEKGSDFEARGDMMKAAMMGAVAFQKGLGACHSLAHPLSSEKHLHHGLSNALCLPAVVEFNDDAIHPKLERIRGILSPQAKSLAEGLRAIRARIGLPGGLRAEGVTESDIPKLAEKAIEDACHRCNPKPVTKNDLAKLYEASL
ncbi:MAG: iron-containing alcohol dehydrogenase [Polyangiaceae bacterium]